MANEGTDPKQIDLTPESIDELVLVEYPYPIAVNYCRMLEERDWEKRTNDCIGVFEYGMRAITLGILSQYLIRDRDEFSYPELNRELDKQKLTNISLGTWVNYLFLALKAYGGRRELFFMQELYDLYWDTSHTPHRPRKGVRSPFEHLVQIRNKLVHKKEVPRDEKGWKKLGEETLKNLREMMRYFRFLQNYDLIRVVEPSGGEYKYERFTGQNITYHQESLKSKEEIQPGWFYLSRQDHTLLGLHPLLIFSTSREGRNWIEGAEPEEQDVALFEELLKDVAGYIATVIREFIKKHDATLISQLRDLLYYNLEEVKMKMARQRAKLSWVTVGEAVRQISSDEMKSAQKKYNQALYLQRDTIYNEFQSFLSSDKTCLVLTGKSGVGKSNFVLSLAKELASSNYVSVLMYNANRLDVSSIRVVQKISQDLGKLIQLQAAALVNVFAELDKSEDMTGKQLIVVFDAINENANPREVLQGIDKMVGEERYSWLKVLITSRPEGWRTMKRGLPLATERYYKERGSEELTVELEEFTVKLEIFERDELQDVYEKYSRVFNLQTDYFALRPAVRNALRDPLVLRLVSEIYKDKPIPDYIHVNDIYRLYIDSMISDKAEPKRLYQQDVILLEQELMPLMLRRGFYENKLTASQVQTARTKDGRPIWELIHSTDPLGDGQKVNDSYVRLRDTELLDENGSGMDYTIGFKYERFYEFFGGRRLYYAARE